MGLPAPSDSAFALDPEIKRECIWSGPVCNPGRILVDRSGPSVKVRTERGWQTLAEGLSLFESLFVQIADPNNTPEVVLLREKIRGWRFYDQLRTDVDAPCRIPKLGTRTPVLSDDDGDLTAAIQTILEIGDPNTVNEAVHAAFPGATLNIGMEAGGRFRLEFQQPGLLRPLSGPELSDGTLRFLLWLAALLTPRPPVHDGAERAGDEPASRSPPRALSHLIIEAGKKMQVWVVTHSPALISALQKDTETCVIELQKDFGQTQVKDQSLLDRPNWQWVE